MLRRDILTRSYGRSGEPAQSGWGIPSQSARLEVYQLIILQPSGL